MSNERDFTFLYVIESAAQERPEFVPCYSERYPQVHAFRMGNDGVPKHSGWQDKSATIENPIAFMLVHYRGAYIAERKIKAHPKTWIISPNTNFYKTEEEYLEKEGITRDGA